MDASPSPAGLPAVCPPGPALLQHGHTLLTTRHWLKDMQWGQKSGGGRGLTRAPSARPQGPGMGGPGPRASCPLQPLTCPQPCLRPLRCPPLIVPKVGLALGCAHPTLTLLCLKALGSGRPLVSAPPALPTAPQATGVTQATRCHQTLLARPDLLNGLFADPPQY